MSRTPEEERKHSAQIIRIKRLVRIETAISNEKEKHERAMDRLNREYYDMTHKPGCTHQEMNGASAWIPMPGNVSFCRYCAEVRGLDP